MMKPPGITRTSTALLALLLLILCLNSLASCTERKTKLNIEMIVAGTETEFWMSAYAGAQAAAEQYNVKVKMFGPGLESDYRRQEGILRQSITRKPDAIILAANDSSITADLPNPSAVDGITLIAIHSGAGGSKWVSYVGSDNYRMGTALAAEIKSRFTGGAVAVVSFIEESPAAQEREAGFLDEMAESPAFLILETAYCDSDIETAKTLALKLMAENDNLAAIACLNSQSTIGSGMAIEETGTRSVFLAGIDCTTEEVGLIERGILGVTLLQNPYAMGYFGLEAAVKSLRGEPPEKTIHTAFRVINKENLFSEENQRLIFPL